MVCKSINQSTTWSVYRSTSQCVNQSINRSISQSISPSINQLSNQSSIQSFSKTISQSNNQSINQLINPSTSQSTSQSIRSPYTDTGWPVGELTDGDGTDETENFICLHDGWNFHPLVCVTAHTADQLFAVCSYGCTDAPLMGRQCYRKHHTGSSNHHSHAIYIKSSRTLCPRTTNNTTTTWATLLQCATIDLHCMQGSGTPSKAQKVYQLFRI